MVLVSISHDTNLEDLAHISDVIVKVAALFPPSEMMFLTVLPLNKNNSVQSSKSHRIRKSLTHRRRSPSLNPSR